METVYRPLRNRQLEKQLEDRNAMSNKPMLTCRVCGHTGQDVSEQPYYDGVYKRDTTEPLCNDIEACLDRVMPSYYKRR